MKGWKWLILCFRWQDGLDRRYVWDIGTAGVDSDKRTAGSALIQACEKAGVTIPRWALRERNITCKFANLFSDTAIMSECYNASRIER
jgi:hypothetical protein